MKAFILVWIGVTVFARISINKEDIPYKDAISIALGLLLTSLLTFIQFLVDSIIKLIF